MSTNNDTFIYSQKNIEESNCYAKIKKDNAFIGQTSHKEEQWIGSKTHKNLQANIVSIKKWSFSLK